MKSARLLRILLLLQTRSPRSARELADELEVCERTVYRDVEALGAGGVPIFATRGAQGGIHLMEGYRRAIAELDEDEIHALYVSGSDPLADLGFGSPLQRAREKLSGALSERQKNIAEKARARIRVDQRRWGQDEAPTETLGLVRRAVWDDRRIAIMYRDRMGVRTTREIDPLGLVSKSGVWYVVARSGDELRSFRADRILSTALTEEHFERPRDFDLDTYWSQSSRSYEGMIERLPVTVRADRSMLDTLTAYWHPKSVDENETQCVVRFEFPARGAAIQQLLAWGNSVTILEPVDLVDDILALARDVLVHYAG
ncbi:MAG: YafY family protein [Vulcanimicrobiaceae bacterium]